ncbi:unnamed protein product [Clonostachys rosea]|uniref:Aminoglycoside phosphotransferase domain-containing protein n=1 Tax=Bionectria ochroleuca TaxID=29856 RepID=A0ABY6UJB5_BIOOC|nr:unnamed protein product [Clonostachys rosea]
MAIEIYSAETTINNFFAKASTTRAECEAQAVKLTGGKAVLVAIQGDCNYSVYSGPELEYVVQFRLKPLEVKMTTATLASQIYGKFAPIIDPERQIGDEIAGKEPLCIYVMSRVKGISYLDLMLASENLENSPAAFAARKTLMTGVAKLFPSEYWYDLQRIYYSELVFLSTALPERFRPAIQSCIGAMKSIMSLPMVFLNRDSGTSTIMINEDTCQFHALVGWAEDIRLFGVNLHSLQQLTGRLHFRDGWSRYDNYDDLHETFWSVYLNEVGGLPEATLQTIELARILGLLLSRGFTSRLKSSHEPVPI